MPRFQEIQRFPLWADLLVLGVGFVLPLSLWASLGREPEALRVMGWVSGAWALIWLCFFRMKTEVDKAAVTVTFGWIPTYRRRIPLADIAAAEPRRYHPIREYGGWGIRGIPVSAFNARGDRGVQLTLRSGQRLLIGSQVPEKLARAIFD